MAGPIEVISKAISDNRVDGTWTVKKTDSCDANKEEFKHCKTGTSFDVSASYRNASGAELIFHGHQPVRGVFNPDTGAFYNTTIRGKKVGLWDYHIDNPSGTTPAKSTTVWKPDGRITEGDELDIDGRAYRFWDVSVPDSQGVHQNTDVYEFKAYDARYDEAGYDGLQFKKEGDKWVFVGPADKREKGTELERLLSEVGAQYSTALGEAAQHIKP